MILPNESIAEVVDNPDFVINTPPVDITKFGVVTVPEKVGPDKFALPFIVVVRDVCMRPYNKSPVTLASPFICNPEPVIPAVAVTVIAVKDEPLLKGARLDNFVDKLKPPAYNKSVHVMLLLLVNDHAVKLPFASTVNLLDGPVKLPVYVGLAIESYKFSAVCVAVLTGLLKSVVLSTLPKPTINLLIPLTVPVNVGLLSVAKVAKVLTTEVALGPYNRSRAVALPNGALISPLNLFI